MPDASAMPHVRPAALADEARQFALLLESVTDYAIYMLDADGVVRSWNTGGERIKGWRADEIIGQHFSRFYTPEDVASGLPEKGLSVARELGRFEAEGWRVRKDGSRFLANVVIDPIRQDGELIGYAKVTRDITERHHTQLELQAAQQALLHSQKMEAIANLTLGLAHDFNNLLTIVLNSLDLLAARPGMDERGQSLVRTAACAADRATLLTRHFLAFGRGQRLEPRRGGINALLRDSAELYRRACGDEIEFALRLGEGLPEVEVDVSQLESALLNLIANSRNAMPGGGRIVLSTCAAVLRNPNDGSGQARMHVCVAVEDTGEGIPAELRDRVFEPFFTTKDIGKGSGLGLSQVFGFAAQSGGFVELDSTPGQGTTVRVCLPAAGPA
jgi:PAS domain S-box-containing protein